MLRSILGVLKSRTFLIAIGVLCLALLIWVGGPWVGFTSTVGRLLAILVIVVIWALLMQLRQARDARATAELTEGDNKAEGAGGTSAARQAAAAPGAETKALRECFAEAATFLKRSGKGGGSLYDLPWYAIIGPPGTGKTTLIEKSGLRFPVAQRAGARKVTGVGGTRNCQWWFTDEAILLDTAGRYTTQDSNAQVDKDGWREFLSLLKGYRRRRPLNGLFVAFSAADLASKSDETLERDALVIRERLDEIQSTLSIALPVYFLITQSDLIAGFTEFFDDLDQEARRQVWGFTFDVRESERGTAIAQFEKHFDELSERLSARLMTRLHGERDLPRRIAVLGFPSQFASLEARLGAFLRDVFSSSRFERALLLRGVYFTSGTQVGAPIDRMMDAVAREFGLSAKAAEQPALAGRAFFIEKLLRGVVFPESGLAGTQRSLEIRKAAAQLSAYLACLALAALSILWLTVSYAKNSSYLREVRDALAQFQASPAAAAPAGTDMMQTVLHLDGLRSVVDVAERHGERAPWGMRFGLYQVRAMGEAVRDAYVRSVNEMLVPLLAGQLRERLGRVVAEPENLFESLKAYLLLNDHKRITKDKDDLAQIAKLEWLGRYGADPSVPARLSAHLAALLDSEQALAAPPQDADTVAEARSSLSGLTPKRLVYGRIARIYSADPGRGLRLDVALGLGADKVLTRRSRRPLSEPVAYLYTRPAFQEISTTGALKATASFVDDGWVYGENRTSLQEQARLTFDVLSLYEDDYITAWDALIGDIGLKPVVGETNVAEALRILSANDSPIRALLKTIADNTDLVKPDAAKQGGNALSQLESGGTALLAKAVAAAQAQLGGGKPPGTRITEHFRPIFGANAAVDQCLTSLGQISQQLSATSAALATSGGPSGLAQGGAVDMAHGVQLCAASLPAPLNGIMKQASAASQAAAVKQASGQLGDRMAQQLGGDCKDVITGRYPFSLKSSNDVPLADFGRLFGAGGTLDQFFQANLAPLVDTRGGTWHWRQVNDMKISMSPAVLPAFQQAARIREAYFQPPGPQPQVHFTLRAESLDPDVLRFVLTIDGQTFEYRHDPPAPWNAVWPGTAAPGTAAVRFEDSHGNSLSVPQIAPGPWAWFRLLDTADIERQSDTHYRVTFHGGGKSAQISLDASSIHNPFGGHPATQFRCPD
jgi:type VI secretion system protein ImpL